MLIFQMNTENQIREKLIERIEEYIREYGAFKIEEVNTNSEVRHEGCEVTYFDLWQVKVEREDKNEYIFYRDLPEDTLLDILYVAMAWKNQWDEKEKNEA